MRGCVRERPREAIAPRGRFAPAQASELLRAGIVDLVDPSCGDASLLAAIERATREEQLRRELAMLRARVGDSTQRAMIGRSPAMERVRELVGRAAASCAPMLVTGERGVGKRVVARLVHDLSERAARPQIFVRCAGTDSKALEQQLFGCGGDEGTHGRAGLLEEGGGGTIVLEDAPAPTAALRSRLASAVFSRTVRRVGGDQAIPIGARLVFVAQADTSEARRRRRTSTSGRRIRRSSSSSERTSCTCSRSSRATRVVPRRDSESTAGRSIGS